MARLRALWREMGFGRPKPSTFTRAQLSRRATITGGTVALAACALAACSEDPLPDAAPMLAPQVNAEPRTPTVGTRKLAIAGDRLNAPLLRRFYARHSVEPVWATRQAQANSLVDAVLRAGDHGLDPDLFHADLLRRRATLPPLDRELLLSDAFLSYADALARGAVPVERRRDDEVLTPDPIDVAAVLDTAIRSPDPAAVIEALAPTTPTYRALREALQRYRSGAPARDKPAAVIEALALATPTHRALRQALQKLRSGAPARDNAGPNRLRTIEVNLERQRWLPRSLPADRAWVNIADQRLVLYRADRPVFSTRVVVGEDVRHNQSPEFRATIDASFFNPPWVVPKDIVTAEILPKISRDPDYLTRNNMILLPSGDAEQLPGPEAGLGLIMFDMPNRFDVYLHDTPDRQIFNLDNRRISHGCIRVQDPRDFAALLLQEPIDAINQGITQGLATGNTTRHDLPTPVPVFVVYETAFMDTDGTLQFRPDFYDRDAEIWQRLHPRPQAHSLSVQADNHPASFGVPTF